MNLKRNSSTSVINDDKFDHLFDPRRSISECTFRRNTFIIFNTDFVNYFDQTNLKTIRKYFYRRNEVDFLNNKIKYLIKKEIREKLFSVLNERENRVGMNTKRRVDINKSKSNSRDSSLKNELKFENKNESNSPIKNIEHLIPEKKKHKELLNTKFVFDKMFEFRYNGMLNKKLDVEKVKKQLKILKHKPQKNINIKRNLEMTEKLVENYYMNRNSISKLIRDTSGISSNNLNQNSVVYVDHNKNKNDIKVETNSNYYVKINRDKMDLKIDLRNKKKKNNNIFNQNPNRTFYKNIPPKEELYKDEWTNNTFNTNTKKELTPLSNNTRERVLSSKIKIINI